MTASPFDEGESFYYTAASYSFRLVMALLLGCVLLSAVLSQIADFHTRKCVALIFVGVGCCVVIAAAVLGIAALFGIPRYGVSRILVKSLVGIFVPALLVAVAVPFFLHARSVLVPQNAQTRHDDELAAFVNFSNKKCPQMLATGIRMDGVEILPPKTVLFKVTVVARAKDEILWDAMAKNGRSNLLASYQSSDAMKLFRENGATLIHRYGDKNGQWMGDIVVGPSDLPK